MSAHEYCVLYAYHRRDEVTTRHLELIRAHNPDAPVIPVTLDAADRYPGTLDLARVPSRFRVKDSWRSCDVMVYRWFAARTVEARRYIWLEWDCRCTIRLDRFYAPVWNAAVAARAYFQRLRNPDWHYFRREELAKLPRDEWRYASAILPLAGILYSHRALEQIALAATDRDDVFCELRLGTTIRKLGLDVRRFTPEMRRGFDWSVFRGDVSAPGLYHAV